MGVRVLGRHEPVCFLVDHWGLDLILSFGLVCCLCHHSEVGGLSTSGIVALRTIWLLFFQRPINVVLCSIAQAELQSESHSFDLTKKTYYEAYLKAIEPLEEKEGKLTLPLCLLEFDARLEFSFHRRCGDSHT
jgi:hypothetical protein